MCCLPVLFLNRKFGGRITTSPNLALGITEAPLNSYLPERVIETQAWRETSEGFFSLFLEDVSWRPRPVGQAYFFTLPPLAVLPMPRGPTTLCCAGQLQQLPCEQPHCVLAWWCKTKRATNFISLTILPTLFSPLFCLRAVFGLRLLRL